MLCDHQDQLRSVGERRSRWGLSRWLAVAAVAATALVSAGLPGPAAASQRPSAPPAAGPEQVARDVAPAGTNLIQNGGAEVGDASGNGYDAVTIPGWLVTAGLPSVIRYGLAGFVPPGTPHPPGSGRQLFIGGAGGPATLSQDVGLLGPDGRPLGGATTYELSASLGGRLARPEAASVTLEFLDDRSRPLSTVTLGPVTDRQRRDMTELLRRQGTGRIPAGATRAIVTIDLDTAARGYNGPDGSTVGFNSAYADDLQFSLSRAVEAPTPLQPPPAQVPRYDHVVVVYLENQDYGDIVGNTRQAPFVNQLISSGTLLSQAFAEEHPSDANYLAFAAGSALDLPLTDPAEENSQYTLDAPNIGDLAAQANKSWKAYLQSADGPCDDTVHDQYWDDDLPFLYFKDVRKRPAYCAAHVVPESQWTTDLKSAATTPSLSWLGANDCDDMEGCGIKAGDSWLRSEITPLLHSPAWTSQRTLLIVTWDEDAEDGQHPAQRIPTVVVGSRLVKRGYVSTVRYTHYSLLRTTEEVLGLGSLTNNDRFAQPLNDVFTGGGPPLAGTATSPEQKERGKGDRVEPRMSTAPVPRVADRPAIPTEPSKDFTGYPSAWVVDSMTACVTPVDVTSGIAGARVAVGADPDAALIGPGGGILWVANGRSASVTPVDARTRRAGSAIHVGQDPSALALSPDGRTLLVADEGSAAVTPISTATQRAGQPIMVGNDPSAITISPSLDVAFVLDHDSGEVTPIDLRTLRALTAIPVGSYPVAETLSPDGRWLYVANFGSDDVTPIDTVDRRAEPPVDVGQAPMAVAFLPDGSRAYVVNGDSDDITPITVATRRAARPIPVGSSPEAIVALPGGQRLLVINTVSGTVTPVYAASGRTGAPIPVGVYGYPTAISLAPGGQTVEVVDTYSGALVPIDVVTNRPAPPIEIGSSAFPVTVVPEPN